MEKRRGMLNCLMSKLLVLSCAKYAISDTTRREFDERRGSGVQCRIGMTFW